MSIELLSGRILAPYFGSSIYVWGGVITVFMVALSIGYLIGGRLSIKEPSLRNLSLFLLSAAIATTPIVIMNEFALDHIFSLIQDPRYGSVVSTTLLFFLPTTILGMVSPYAVRLLVKEYKYSGHYTGLLFFVSTFGSAAGTIIDFVLPCALPRNKQHIMDYYWNFLCNKSYCDGVRGEDDE